MSSNLIHIRLLFIVYLMMFFNVAQADDDLDDHQIDVEIDTVVDLGALKRQAEKKSLPVLMLFTAEHCGYCEIIRDEFLLPMIKSGDYESKILIKQIYIDRYQQLRNIEGEEISGDAFALKYNIHVTPTILFLSPTGKELAKRLVGVGNVYYFGGTLDKHIDQALKALNLNSQAIGSTLQHKQIKESSKKQTENASKTI